jgi:hypothetical protein
MLRAAGRLVWLSGMLAGALPACGPGARALPTAPTATVVVSAGLSPVPPTMRRMTAADPSAAVYTLVGQVTFRATGTGPVRIVSMDLVLSDESGPLLRQAEALDLPVEPGVEATVALPSSIRVPTMRVPTRLAVGASGLDANNQPLIVAPVDVLVTTALDAGSVSAAPVTFVGAGDIADCGLQGAALTAQAVQRIPGSVFTLGDHVYPVGTSSAFASCYESTWGAVKSRTYPSPGNHEWEERNGAAYLAYFGGPAARGYYSFDLGAWHVLSLNSNIATQPGSPQYEWVRADLAAHPRPCTLAYWHHPLFSSGTNGPNPQMQAIWRLLDGAGTDLVMAAHDHLYERFAPQDADGRPTPTGIRSFVVGTGGAGLYGLLVPRPNSEIRNNQGWGVLRLTLRGDGYDWEFVPVGDSTFRDFGSASCAP